MKIMRLTVLLLFILFGFIAPAYACECKFYTEEEKLLNADAVFTGTSLEVQQWRHGILWDNIVPIEMIKTNEVASKFMPETTDSEETEIVLIQEHKSTCNYTFEKGKVYKIYAFVNDKNENFVYLSTNKCTGTKEIEGPQNK